MKKIFSMFLLFILFSTSYQILANQNIANAKFGWFGSLNYNQYSADFFKLKNIPNCCPNFETGYGLGFATGIIYEYPITRQFWLGARFGIFNIKGELLKDEATTIITDIGPANGIFEHSLKGEFFNIGFEPTVIYNPFQKLLLSAGLRFGSILSNNFEQIERIKSPSGYGTFLDADGNDSYSRTRNKASGKIPDAVNFQMFLTGAISYELPLNSKGNFLLAPEIQYYFPMNELVKNTDWRVNIIQAGIALKYTPIPEKLIKEIFREENIIDTIRIDKEMIAQEYISIGKTSKSIKKETIENVKYTTEIFTRTDTLFLPRKYLLSADVVAVGVDSLGMEIPNPLFSIEEFVYNRLDPLLNYVFFDDNSSTIPTRYYLLDKKSTEEFNVDSLYKAETLEIYYNVMNIVGARLTKFPNARLTLIGCNSDFGNEKGNIELSSNRAEQVKKYLIDVWNIADNRISIQTRNLPQKASTPFSEADKVEENRRVEIISDDYRIIEPVFIKNIRRTANPPIIRFKPDVASELALSNWELIAYQNKSSERIVISGNEQPPLKIDKVLEEDQRSIPQLGDKLFYYIEIIDEKRNISKSEINEIDIEVLTVSEKRTNRIDDYEIEKFSLILFDFDNANILGNNQKITDYIKSRLQTHSIIEIIGYTDRTGDESHNLRLSERRANNTKQALGRSEAISLGKGEQILLYNNDLPEGRFYCRTVEIIVKTKIN